MEIKQLVITRSRWVRQTEGVDKGESALLNCNGNMCCLGFLGAAVGIPLKCLDGMASPNDHLDHVSALVMWPKDFVPRSIDYGRSLCDAVATAKALAINDNGETTDSEKERELIDLFDEVGIALTFED